MDVVNAYTTVGDENMIKAASIVAKVSLENTLSFLNMDINQPLSTSSVFLTEFTQEIGAQLKKAGYRNYNVIVGKDLIRVFRYQKDSLMTIKWRDLVILMFQFPHEPRFPIDEEPLIYDEVLVSK